MASLPVLVREDAKFRVLVEQVEALGRANQGGTWRFQVSACEVCGVADSTVYCPSDRAHFCASCDASHHGSSKLLTRHVRLPVHHSPLQFGRCGVHSSEFVEFVDLTAFRLLCRVCLETQPATQVVSTLEALKRSQGEEAVWLEVGRRLREAVQGRHKRLLEIKSQLESVSARVKSTHHECTRKIYMHTSNKHDILTSIKKEILLKLLTVELLESWRVHCRLAATPGSFLLNDHVFRVNRNFLLIADTTTTTTTSATTTTTTTRARPVWLSAKIDIQGTLVVADQAISAPLSLVPKADAPLLLEPLPSSGGDGGGGNTLVTAKPKEAGKQRLPLRQAADFSDSISRAEAAVAEVDALMAGRPRTDVNGRFGKTYEPEDALVGVLKGGAFPFENALEILRHAKQSDRQMLLREMLEIYPVAEKREFLSSLIEEAVQTVQTPLLLNSAPSLVVTVVGVLAEDGRVGNLIERAALVLAGRQIGDSETEALLATRRLVDGLMQQRTAEVAQSEIFRFLKTLLFECQKKFGAFTVGLNVCTGLFVARIFTPTFVKRCNGAASVSKALLRVSRGEESGDDDLRELFARIREWMHGLLDEVVDAPNFGVENAKTPGLGKMLQEYIKKYRMEDN